jgi:acyl carrier protein phosphodiesterase
MNYLGHAFLSFGDAQLLTGNMIADHIKGKIALQQFPEGIRNGILLHRKIDSYTDVHPATQRAKTLFRLDYGLFAGPVMDTIFDHFLANDAKHFPSEKVLLEFSLDTYNKLEQHSAYFPPIFAAYFQRMIEFNWLYNYRTLQGAQRSLHGLSRRSEHIPPVDKAYEIFISHYYQLAQCYYELMDDMFGYVKTELNKQ